MLLHQASLASTGCSQVPVTHPPVTQRPGRTLQGGRAPGEGQLARSRKAGFRGKTPGAGRRECTETVGAGSAGGRALRGPPRSPTRPGAGALTGHTVSVALEFAQFVRCSKPDPISWDFASALPRPGCSSCAIGMAGSSPSHPRHRRRYRGRLGPRGRGVHLTAGCLPEQSPPLETVLLCYLFCCGCPLGRQGLCRP